MDYEKALQSELEQEATKRGIDNRGDREAITARLEQYDADNGDDDDADADAPLDSFTKAELQEKADEAGIDYTSSDTKADLIDALENAE